MYKLSIITINYNNLEGLKRTVESVVNQTWQEFKYIVIDGGSTDGSDEYINTQSKNIDYWVSEPDAGIYNAMNKGIAKASGEYLLFLNSGDHFYSNNVLLESHTRIADYDLIYFNLNVVVGEMSYIKTYPDSLSFSYFVKETLPHPATFIKADLFSKFGLYDESLKITADWKFFITSICKFNCSYKKVDTALTVFYLNGLSSDSKNQNMISKEKDTILHLNFRSFIEDNNDLNELKAVVLNLKKSKIIKILVKMGLLNKF